LELQRKELELTRNVMKEQVHIMNNTARINGYSQVFNYYDLLQKRTRIATKAKLFRTYRNNALNDIRELLKGLEQIDIEFIGQLDDEEI